MIINHNIPALNTHRMLTSNHLAAQKAMEKLSSGLRINRAGDDAAGLAISEKMRAQVRGLNQAIRNAQDGISLIQTAEGALTETHAILQRMRELAVQAANDTNTEVDRSELQKEVDQLAEELTRIAETTEFNTKKLLDGSFSGTFHIGANAGQNISLSIENMDAEALGVVGSEPGEQTIDGTYVVKNYNSENITITISNSGSDASLNVNFDSETNTLTISLATDSDGNVTTTIGEVLDEINKIAGLQATLADGVDAATTASATSGTVDAATPDSSKGIDISSQEAADAAITIINRAIETVSAERSKLGAYQNRLEHTINNLGASSENLQAAESRIRDVDMAREIMEFTRANILSQASQAMLAQANMLPQAVLQLLR